MTSELWCRNRKRKGYSLEAASSKRAAVSQEVRVTCGSSSGVYDIRRGCIALRAAQNGQVGTLLTLLQPWFLCRADSADWRKSVCMCLHGLPHAKQDLC